MWIALYAVLLSAQEAQPTCRTADARVEKLIASEARQQGAEEYCQFRRYDALDDIDGDGHADFIVLFTLEGFRGSGNASAQMLAVFSSRARWKPATLQVGGDNRSVVAIAVDADGTIVLSTLEHRDGDPMCCPTGRGELRYRLDGGRLVVAPKK